ncbi:MAG: MBL fold metallo-hydrolase [Kofleriaceae bacterium]|nr:MAG: MBL fold metallo-hydrolase [Kofleriaceae bacterium]MBZ0236951.1 MBL fold metallo-hydrolase [Kofleriaceae bacterium]
MDNLQLTFHGAAGTVTGARFLVEGRGTRLLLDGGLFQGLGAAERNHPRPPASWTRLDGVILSHAHLDHSGYLPVLVRAGYRSAIHCTHATADMVALILRDAARLQREAARRDGLDDELYDEDDIEQLLSQIVTHAYGATFPVGALEARLRRAGHILGSATIELREPQADVATLLYSGDLGRARHPMLRAPDDAPGARTLLVESTYGDRIHPADPLTALADEINRVVDRGGSIVIPTFAIGRAQEILWHLRRLEDDRRIPTLPVVLDSPMAIDATDLFCRFPEEHNLEMEALMDARRCPLCCTRFEMSRTPEESRRLARRHGPVIILAGSGMVTGGRVGRHLARLLPDRRNGVLFVGFQARGTPGRALVDGAEQIELGGEPVPVRASIASIGGLSAHADAPEIIEWLHRWTNAPAHTYVVHGEPEAASAMANRITTELAWPATVAELGAEVNLP